MIRLSIRRPVAVAMLYSTVAILSVLAWRNIPVEMMPDASFPRLTLTLSWPGTSPETMEAFATSPVESTVQQMKGVQKITSTTREGGATIAVEFTRETDMDFARMDLSERVAALEEELPDGVAPITVTPYVPQAVQQQVEQRFMSYVFTGPVLVESLRFHLDEVVVPALLQIKGVEEVEVFGGRRRLLEIELDEDRIAALGLTPALVSQAIGSLDLVRDVGAVREGDREWVVTIRNRPVEARDVREAILPLPGNRAGVTPVLLQDVAVVRDTFEEPTSHFRIDRGPAVQMIVHRERGTNAIRLAEQVIARMTELERQNPPGTRFILRNNQSVDIRREMTDLWSRSLVSALVMFAVLLAFLRSFRTAGVVFATILFSMLIALNVIYFMGLSLNLMTIMGIALGFGLIVDNAVVVMENIYRKWQEGVAPEEAAEKGSRDVVLAIIASTATSLIVFIPFLYLQGELRIFYLPLAIVVGVATFASIFVSFTFIPALTSRVLRKEKASRRWGLVAGTGVSGPEAGGAASIPSTPPAHEPIYVRFYSGLLGHTLRFPWTTVVVSVLCFGATWLLFDKNVTRGRVFGGGSGVTRSTVRIQITMPRGSDLGRMDELTQFFEDRLEQMPEIEAFETTVTATNSNTTVSFPEEMEFTPVPLVIEESIRSFGLGFTGAEVRVYGQGPSFYGGGSGSLPNVRITILGYNYDHLEDIAADLGGRLSQHSRVQNMDTNANSGNFRDRAMQFVATIDRQAAARHGINVQEAVSLVRSRVAGAEALGTVVIGGEPVRYDVKLAGYRLVDVNALEETVVTTSRGGRIPLGELIEIEQRQVLSTILREDQQYQRTVAYEFRGPQALSDTIRNAAMRATVLPAGYSFRTTQTGLITSQEARQINLVLLISLGLVFMVTAALFESIRQPLVVLLAVPMALIGTFLIFFFMKVVFTREAYIGVIMMGGIVVNNSILLVDHINRVRAETTLSVFDAIIRGTLERVRPILMTSGATIFGLLPLVLFTPTANARIWNALTYALIGGLISSTIFILATTPAFYLLFERIGRREGTKAWAEVRWGVKKDEGLPSPEPSAT
jgi:HAE1 family hydrophobic/amphiphilic exporter-1